MKILLKILVAPFALALSLLAALLVFLFDICAVLLTILQCVAAGRTGQYFCGDDTGNMGRRSR